MENRREGCESRRNQWSESGGGGGVDKKKQNKRVGGDGGLEDAHLTEQEPKRGAVRRPDQTNDTEMGFSLFLSPFFPPQLPSRRPISG